MLTKTTARKRAIAAIAVLLVALVASLAIVAVAVARNGGDANQPTMMKVEFDVAEDMNRFAYDADYAFDDDYPAHGSAFITQGYIYPLGTLDGASGTLPDGSPQFPDLVLGEWTCYGYFVGDAAHATTGAWVITSQVYSFGSEVGAETIVTHGYEIADLNQTVQRAITGGTGKYANASGEGSQILLGFNDSEGVNLRFSLDVEID